MPPEGNGWNEWKQYVLRKLDDNELDHRSLSTKLDQLSVLITTHCAQAEAAAKISKVWAGIISMIVSPALFFLFKMMFGM